MNIFADHYTSVQYCHISGYTKEYFSPMHVYSSMIITVYELWLCQSDVIY